MNIGLLFWIIMIFALLFGGWTNFGNYVFLGHGFVVWVLFFLLGWKVFGPPLKE